MEAVLKNGIISLKADTLGAELTSVRVNGREWLWQNESGEWAGHAPVLFPVCGNCLMQVGGKQYPTDRHGFARKSEFVLKRRQKNSLLFELKSSEETRAQYPFDFVLRVRYTLGGATLGIAYEVENPSDEVVYFSCGGHESYALEKPLKEYELRFPRKEKFATLLHDSEGRLTGEVRELASGTHFPLPENLLVEGNTLIFRLRSRRVLLCEKSGECVAEITFPGFSNLLLWRPGTANVICIEPWHNLPDGSEPTEFSKKEGVIALEPHRTIKFIRKITYLKHKNCQKSTKA